MKAIIYSFEVLETYFCGTVFCGTVFCGTVFCGTVFGGTVFCGIVFRSSNLPSAVLSSLNSNLNSFKANVLGYSSNKNSIICADNLFLDVFFTRYFHKITSFHYSTTSNVDSFSVQNINKIS